MLSLYYHFLIEKIEQHQGTKYLMIDDYIVHKASNCIK